jgi:hypothetical protein
MREKGSVPLVRRVWSVRGLMCNSCITIWPSIQSSNGVWAGAGVWGVSVGCGVALPTVIELSPRRGEWNLIFLIGVFIIEIEICWLQKMLVLRCGFVIVV